MSRNEDGRWKIPVPFQIENVRFSNSVVVELARLINADQGLPLLQFFGVRVQIKHELFETALDTRYFFTLTYTDILL